MAELKSRINDASVAEFIASVEDGVKRQDSRELIEMMRAASGADPKMWGSSIVGFGSYHYHYASGREGDWMLCGFSPRKRNLAIYIMAGFESYGKLMQKLGKFSTGRSCLYVKKLDDVDRGVLRELVRNSVEDMRVKYETLP